MDLLQLQVYIIMLSRRVKYICAFSLIIISFIVYNSDLVGDYFHSLNWTPGNTGPATPHEGATWPSSNASWLNPRKKVSSFSLPTASQADSFQSTPSIPDTMPFSTVLMNRTSLLKTDWVMRLYNYLHTTDTSVSPHVNMVFGDYDHRLLVLNWITAALFKIQPPLHNILVVSLEQTLCDYLLMSRDFLVTCITVPVEEILFLLPEFPKFVEWKRGMLVRMPVLRLITHWGYDVAAYDSDAVLLRNPQVLYDNKPNFHIISSAGTFPPHLSKKWGVALCAGGILLRASSALEMFWGHISAIPANSIPTTNDQMCLNLALANMSIVWKTSKWSPFSEICSNTEGWEGRTAPAGGDGDIVDVFVLPQNVFCRRNCCNPNMSHEVLYLVHPQGKKDDLLEKIDMLRGMNAWFLEQDEN